MEKAFCPHMVILIEVLRREKANLHPRLKICPQNNNKLSSITEETLVIYCYIKKLDQHSAAWTTNIWYLTVSVNQTSGVVYEYLSGYSQGCN